MSKCLVNTGSIKTIASNLKLGKFNNAIKLFGKLNRTLFQDKDFIQEFKEQLIEEGVDSNHIDKLISFYKKPQLGDNKSPNSEFINTEDEGVLNNTRFEATLGKDTVLISKVLQELKTKFVDKVLITRETLSKKGSLIKNIQEEYWKELYKYISPYIDGLPNTLFTKDNDQTQNTYNGSFDLYSAQIKHILTNGGSLTTLDLVKEATQNSDLWKAYKAFVILKNFDYLIKDVSIGIVKVSPNYMNQIASFDNKYEVTNINNLFDNWRDSDEDVDYSSEMGAIAQLVMDTTPMYVNGVLSDKHMSRKQWMNMWAFIRTIVFNRTQSNSKLSNIKLDTLDISDALNQDFDSSGSDKAHLQNIYDKYKNKTISQLITLSFKENDALELLFNVLVYGREKSLNIDLEEVAGDYILSKGNSRNYIYSVFKKVFDRSNSNSLIQISKNTKNANLFFFITKALTTTSPLNYTQLEIERDDKGNITSMKDNLLSSTSYDKTRKDFEDSIKSRFNRLNRAYWDAFIKRYNVRFSEEEVQVNEKDTKTVPRIIMTVNGKEVKLNLTQGITGVIEGKNPLSEEEVKELFRVVTGTKNITNEFFENYKLQEDKKNLDELLSYCGKVICNAYIILEPVALVFYNPETNQENQETNIENSQEGTSQDTTTNVAEVQEFTQHEERPVAIEDLIERRRPRKPKSATEQKTEQPKTPKKETEVIIAFRQDAMDYIGEDPREVRIFDSLNYTRQQDFASQRMGMEADQLVFNKSLGHFEVVDKSLLVLSRKIARAIELTNGTEAKGVDRDSHGNALANSSPCRVFEHYDFIVESEIRNEDGHIYPIYQKFSAINDVDNLVPMREIRNGEKAVNLSRQEMYYISLVHDFYENFRNQEATHIQVHPFVLSDKSTVVKARLNKQNIYKRYTITENGRTRNVISIDEVPVETIHQQIMNELGNYYSKITDKIAADWKRVEELLGYTEGTIYDSVSKTFNKNIKYRDIIEQLSELQFNGVDIPNIYEEFHCVVDKNGLMHFNATLKNLVQRFSDKDSFNAFVYLQNLNIAEALYKDKVQLPASIILDADKGTWSSGNTVIVAQHKKSDGTLVPIQSLQEFLNLRKSGANIVLNPYIEKHNWFCYLYSSEVKILTMGGYISDKASGIKYGYNPDGTEIQIDPLAEEEKRSVGSTKRAASVAVPLDLYQETLYGLPSQLNIATFETPSTKTFNYMGDKFEPLTMDGAMFTSGVTLSMQNTSLGASAAGTTQKAFGEAKDPTTGNHIQLKMASFGMTGNNQNRSEEMRKLNLKSLELPLSLEEQAQLYDGIVSILGIQNSKLLFSQYANDFGGITKVGIVPNTDSKTFNITIWTTHKDGTQTKKTIRGYQFKSLAELYSVMGAEKCCNNKGQVTVEFADKNLNRLSNIICKSNLKHKVIHYFCPKDSMKRGYANVNSYDRILSDKPVAYQRVNMTFYGLLLDKTHETEGAKVSILSQVVNALCARGYTEKQAMETYKALEQVALAGVSELIDVNEDILKNEGNADKIRADIQELRRIVASYVIKESAFKEDSVLSAIVDKYKDYYDKGIIKFSAELPLSSGNVFNQFNTILSSVISRASIKLKFDGTLSVLTPSHGIYKIFGGKGLDEYTSRNELFQTRKEFDKSIVKDPVAIQKALMAKTLLPNYKISLGTSYNVYDENGEIIKDSVTNLPIIERVDSMEDYYRIRGNSQYKYFKEAWFRRGDIRTQFESGSYYEVVDAEGNSTILKCGLENAEYFNKASVVYEFITEGRDLEPYNVFFQAFNKLTGEVEYHSLWDSAVVHDITQNPANKDRTALQNTLHSINKGGNIEIYNPEDGSTYTVQVLSDTIEVKPYENISNPTALKKLGIPPGTKLSEITIDFFKNKLKQDSGYKIPPIIDKKRKWNYEIKRADGNHIYVIDSNDATIDRTGLSEYSPEYVTRRGGLLGIKGDNGDIEFVIDSNDEVDIYVNEAGQKVIVTNNPESVLSHNKGTYIVFNIEGATNLTDNNGKDVTREKFIELLEKFPNMVHTASSTINKELDTFLDKKATQLYYSFKQTLYNLVARIPSQSMQSFMAMETVAFDNTGTNNLYISIYQILLQGSDFDIDTATVLGYDLDRNGLLSKWSPLFDYSSSENLKASLTLPFPTGNKIKEAQDDEVFTNLDAIKHKVIVLEKKLEKKQKLNAQDIKTLAQIIRMENSGTGVDYSYTEGDDSVEVLNIKKLVEKHNNYINIIKKRGGSVANMAKNFISYNMYSIIENPINIIQAQSPIDDVTREGKQLAQGIRSIVVPIYQKLEDTTATSDVEIVNVDGIRQRVYLKEHMDQVNNGQQAPYLEIVKDPLQNHYTITIKAFSQDFSRPSQLQRLEVGIASLIPKGATYSIDGVVTQDIMEELFNIGFQGKSSIISTKVLQESYVPNIGQYENLPGNIYNNGKEQATNLTGKEGVSVSAAQMKGVLGVVQATNLALTEDLGQNPDLQTYITFNKNILGKSYTIIANAYSEITGNQLTVQESKDLYDALLTISSLISLSADNAKDLALNKIMAIKEFMNLYTAGAMLGMNMGEVSRIAVSNITKWAYPRMRANVFTGYQGFKSIEDIIKFAEQGPEINRDVRHDIEKLVGVKLSNDNTIGKLIPDKKQSSKEIEQGIPEDDNLDYEWVLQGVYYLVSKGMLTSKDLDTLINNCEGSKQMVEWLELLKLINSDKIRVVGDNNNIVQVNLWEELKKLHSVGNELLQLSSIFKINKEISTDILTQLKFKRSLEDILKRAYNRSKGYNKVINQQEGKQFEESPGKIKIDELLSGSKEIIDKYEKYKSAVNVPYVIASNPHYLGYLKAFYANLTTKEKTSRKFRLIQALYEQVKQLTAPRNENEENAIIRTIENHLDALVINEWMRNRDIKIKMPKGVTIVDSFHKPLTPASEGLPITLGTSWGNASFIRYMHSYVFLIIDQINQGLKVENLQELIGNDISEDDFIALVNSNTFLQSLEPRVDTRTLSGNARYVYTANLDLIGDESLQNLTVQKAQHDLEILKSVKFRGQSLYDLLFLYNAIVFNDKPSKYSFSKLFINSLSTGTSELLNDYYKYVEKWDSSYLIGDNVLKVDDIEYEYKDIPPYLYRDIAGEVAFSENKKAPYYKSFDGTQYILHTGSTVNSARNSYRLPSIKLASRERKPIQELSVTLSPSTSITIKNNKITSIFYNNQIVNIKQALDTYNQRHSEDTPITVDDLLFSKITIASLETKPDESGNTKDYTKVVARDLNVAMTLQSIERILNDPC